MKEFFSNMNLARAIIVLTIPICLGLGYFGWDQSRKLEEAHDNLKVRLPKLATEVQQAATDHTNLTRAVRKDGLSQGNATPETYIRKIAAKERVEIGDVKINKRESRPSKGVVDKKYEIRPSDTKRRFSRVKISNFLYKLEEESSRVKVTHVKMETGQRGLKEEQVPDDKWTLLAEVTSRQADEK